MSVMAVALLFILYCFEAGIFLILAPWTHFWATSPLFHATPLLTALTESFYVRGMVSGIGILHLFVGVREILLLLSKPGKASRRPARREPQI
jgi:hypothetical protein